MNTSISAAPWTPLDNDLSLALERDGLTKQRTLQKPISSSRSTTLEPMKPEAPVTRIKSCFPMMKPLFSVGFIDCKTYAACLPISLLPHIRGLC